MLGTVDLARSWRFAKIHRSLPSLVAFLAGGLYSCSLPLWEGWDEPQHYGYIETVRTGELPVVGKATLTKEIVASFPLTPLPKFLSEAVSSSASFSQFSQLAPVDRLRRRRDLESLPTRFRDEKSVFVNYEAQQAPLAYLVLVPFDEALSGARLVNRILLLRLLCSFAGSLLTLLALQRLLVTVNVPRHFHNAVIVCVFCSQVLLASISHVSNDWLAIPLTVWFLVLLAKVVDGAREGEVMWLAVTFGLGLLTKAYFLALAPIFSAALLWRAWRTALSGRAVAAGLILPLLLAGPWYARNLALYGSLSGTQESIRGVPGPRLLEALVSINWPRSFVSFFRASLWSGNWSFTPFRKGPLNVEMALLIASWAVCLIHFRALTRGARWAIVACGCFLTALAYQTCVAWVESGGALSTTEPWYSQGVLVFLWVAAFAGLARVRRAGRVVAAVLCGLSASIAAATFLVFLIPGYAGYIERPNAALAWTWWNAHPSSDLRLMALAPPAVFVFLALYLPTLGISAASAISNLFDSPPWVGQDNH
jgi:hypothetical protein